MTDTIKHLSTIHFSLILVSCIALYAVMDCKMDSELEKELKQFKQAHDSGNKNIINEIKPEYIEQQMDIFTKKYRNFTGNGYVEWNQSELRKIFLFNADSSIMQNEDSFDKILNAYINDGLEVVQLKNIVCDTVSYGANFSKESSVTNIRKPKMRNIKVVKMNKDTIEIKTKILHRFSTQTAFTERVMNIPLTCDCELKTVNVCLSKNEIAQRFPSIYRFLPEIKYGNTNDALVFASNLKKEEFSKKTVKIFDVNIGVRFIGLSMSMVIIMMLIYLNSFLKAMHQRRNTIQNGISWIGLIGNNSARIFNIVTLVILPTLIVFSTSSIFASNIILPLLTTIISGFFSFSVYRNCELLIQIVKNMPNDEPR